MKSEEAISLMEFEPSQNLNVSFNVQLQTIAIITLGSAQKMKKSMKNAFYFLLVKISIPVKLDVTLEA